MTRRFVLELDKLKELLGEMSRLVEGQIEDVITALFRHDQDLARNVIEYDSKVDEYEITVDRTCEEIMALSQPVASDLRLLVSGLKMSTDLERMGDQASNIAKQLLNQDPIEPSILKSFRIDVMTDFVTDMVTEALDAFTHGDAAQAKAVCDSDDEVDEINLYAIQKLSTKDAFGLNPSQRVQMLLISQNLERIGDLATNIAEDVIFLVQARIIKHNYQTFAE
ncbi:MAG TPA: phosphate signaling complex protein PhoU [bacterium]|nr:phosphate signaling complex protein PhoU [bacterium]